MTHTRGGCCSRCVRRSGGYLGSLLVGVVHVREVITIKVFSSDLFDLCAQFFSPRSFEEKLSHLRKQAAFKTEATAGELEAVRTAIVDNEKQWKEVLPTTPDLHHQLAREALYPPYTPPP